MYNFLIVNDVIIVNQSGAQRWGGGRRRRKIFRQKNPQVYLPLGFPGEGVGCYEFGTQHENRKWDCGTLTICFENNLGIKNLIQLFNFVRFCSNEPNLPADI